MIQRYNALALILVVPLVQLLAAPIAGAQTLYLDTNGDGLNWELEFQNGRYAPADCVNEQTTSIDVYLVTNRNPDGTELPCISSTEPRTVNFYEFILRWVRGQITVNGWTDNMGFGTPFITKGDSTVYASGSDVWVGRGGDSQPPGTYKLGTLSITVTGTPYVAFVANTALSFEAFTGFGSACSGSDVPGAVLFGSDVPLGNTFGTCGYTPVVPITWGKIKQHYK